MQDKEKLIQAMNQLADKLRKGQISFMDVYMAVNKRKLRIADGRAHYSEDIDHVEMKAVEDLAIALAEAFLREQEENLRNLGHAIGYGVTSGIFGPTFFQDIKHQK